jgi:hypothetical protein
MRSAWSLAQDVKFRAIEANLYILQFFCLGDWEKVMQGGPWNFRNSPVCIEPYDGFTKPSTIDLVKIAVWAQIHDLWLRIWPEGWELLKLQNLIPWITMGTTVECGLELMFVIP